MCLFRAVTHYKKSLFGDKILFFFFLYLLCKTFYYVILPRLSAIYEFPVADHAKPRRLDYCRPSPT